MQVSASSMKDLRITVDVDLTRAFGLGALSVVIPAAVIGHSRALRDMASW